MKHSQSTGLIISMKNLFSLFLLLAGTGKLLRYAVLAWATMGISG